MGQTIQGGSPTVPAEALAAVYTRLRALAFALLRSERAGHTLQPTALANEAIARLLRSPSAVCDEPEALVGLLTGIMRKVLVDHARSARARRRRERSLDAAAASAMMTEQAEDFDELMRLHHAIAELERAAPRRASVVAHHYFGGLATEQIADLLGVSQRTVQLELAVGRRFVQLAVSDAAGPPHNAG